MQVDDYIERHLPDPVVFLGERLRPLSIGHLIILHRFKCAFVRGEPAGLSDLLLTIFTLRRTYAEAVKAFSLGEHIDWAKQFPKRFKRKPFDLDEEIALMRGVMAIGTQAPIFYLDGGGEKINSPFLAVLKIFLCETLHLPVNDALDYPFALAYYEYASWLEMNGRARLETTESRAEHDKAVAEFAKQHPEFA